MDSSVRPIDRIDSARADELVVELCEELAANRARDCGRLSADVHDQNPQWSQLANAA